MKTVVVVLLVSYLVGAIPWSWLLVRVRRGVDLRQIGSGNLGATNTYRALGASGAIAVLALDILKGWVAPAGFARMRLDTPTVDPIVLPALAGFAAILGHIFPVYMGFRGGKGIATSAGVFLALEPMALAIAAVVFLAGVLASRGIVSVGSLLGALALPLAAYGIEARAPEPSWAVVALAGALTVVLFVKHAANLRRLVHGEEKRLFGPRAAAGATRPDPSGSTSGPPAAPRGGEAR